MLKRSTKPSGGTKQNKMAFDHGHAAIPPPFASPPKLFLASCGEVSPERAEAVTSPTSILLQAASPTSPATCVRSSATTVPFSRSSSGSSDRWSKSKSHPWETKPVGLGLVGALNGEAPDDVVSTVLTGKKLRVQTNYAPSSPSKELGVKSRNGAAGAPAFADHLVQYASPRRCMSPREMEMSEDYTCVIARGPNTRTTHIFDNRVVESRGGFSATAEWAASGTDDFLRYCHGCSKDLGQGKDIFMYRGERAFCSRECRYHEMLFDEGIEEF